MIIGEKYEVNCVLTNQFPLDIPIIGTVHADPELDVHFEHIHIDWRFASQELLKIFGFNEEILILPIVPVNCHPIFYQASLTYLRSFDSHYMYEHFYGGKYSLFSKMEEKYIGSILCKTCPHKGTSLENIEPVNGKIVCPAHGLTWHIETKKLIRKKENIFLDP